MCVPLFRALQLINPMMVGGIGKLYKASDIALLGASGQLYNFARIVNYNIQSQH